MSELLPCPFCGNSAEALRRKPNLPFTLATCEECQFTLPIDRWNTRAKPAQQDAPTDADLRKAWNDSTGGTIVPEDVLAFGRMVASRYAPAQDAERERAGNVREPKNGNGWKVVWWNESMRMMLPEHRELGYCQFYKNGTMTMTVKEIDAARAQRAAAQGDE